MTLFDSYPAQVIPRPDERPRWWASVGAAVAVVSADDALDAHNRARRALVRAGIAEREIDRHLRIERADEARVEWWNRLVGDTRAAREARTRHRAA